MQAPSPAQALDFARHSLIAYTIAFRRDYRAAAIHHLIANALQRVESGECRRLMLFLPPRHGKSMLTSQYFPAWYLGRNPSHSIMAATYSQDLAADFGRVVRNQMIDPRYGEIFPECQISDDSASATQIATRQHGNYYALGIGGSATGRGANVLVIDDPHKDRAEAESEVTRKRAKEWFQSVAYTRLMPGGAIILMLTRWHVDDLAGWQLSEHADEGWEVVKVPAINERGEAAWPEAFPLSVLESTRRQIGPREWSALYQQTPTAGGGGEFRKDWIQYYQTAPLDLKESCNRYLLIDPAGEQRPNNDYTAIWVVGLNCDGNYYVLDIVRDRLNLPQRGRMVMQLHRKWRPFETRYERYGMMGDVQYLKELQERENYRFAVTEVAGYKLKKNDRIRRLLPLFEQQKFYLPGSLAYTDHEGVTHDLVRAFIEEEYSAFDAAAHDDMFDCLSRIAEPDLPLVWPQTEDDGKVDRYNKNVKGYSAWAA